MGRRRREHVRCPDCGWVGITARGKLRLAIFAIGLVVAASLIVLEWIGALTLGDQVWVIALTVLLVSIALRALIRGDRCHECNATVSYR